MQSDLDAFLRSREMAQFERWLRGVNELVVSKKLTDVVHVSPVRWSESSLPFRKVDVVIIFFDYVVV